MLLYYSIITDKTVKKKQYGLPNWTWEFPQKPGFLIIKPGFFRKTRVGWVFSKKPGFLTTLLGNSVVFPLSVLTTRTLADCTIPSYWCWARCCAFHDSFCHICICVALDGWLWRLVPIAAWLSIFLGCDNISKVLGIWVPFSKMESTLTH